MNLPRMNDEVVNSPLQQLELQMASARPKLPALATNEPGPGPYSEPEPAQSQSGSGESRFGPSPSSNVDRESIYSFDSVSTNGRLLDRLGLDSEDLDQFDDGFDPHKRDSVASIQTTGRLLDRLGLEDDDYPVSRNNSVVLRGTPSRTPLLALLGRQKPISVSSSSNLQRIPSTGQRSGTYGVKPVQIAHGNTNYGQSPSGNITYGQVAPDFNSNQMSSSNFIHSNFHNVAGNKSLSRHNSAKVNVKNAPINVVLQNRNSLANFLPDLASIRDVAFLSSSSLESPYASQSLSRSASIASSSTVQREEGLYGTDPNVTLSPPTTPKHILASPNSVAEGTIIDTEQPLEGYDDFNFSSSNESVDNSFGEAYSRPPVHDKSLRSPPSVAPGLKFRSASDGSVPQPEFVAQSPEPRRITSDNHVPSLTKSPSSSMNSLGSSKSDHNMGSSKEVSLESRTKQAIQLRSMGNHREASYQLQLAANIPNNYPKAMYLYAMGLRFGQGVKQNDGLSLKWLCKCILVSTSLTHNPGELNIYVGKLNELQPEDLVRILSRDMDAASLDPIKMFDHFSSIPTAELQKVKANSTKLSNTTANAYHEIGNALVNGWGFGAKDELEGIRFLSKAASLGFVNSMIQLGEMWGSKSKAHKKDYYLSAAWLRLSELFGSKSIGNSWIYKDKYVDSKHKK